MTQRRRKISNEAVEKATGQRWDEWFRWLDAEGARELTHSEIAQRIRAHVDSGWWAQSIAVEYEYERGLRTAVGSTEDAGFQVGVQRTLPLPQKQVWQLLISRRGLQAWLGDAKSLPLKIGAEYVTADGARGEIRSLVPGQKLRLTWHPPGLKKSSTVQVYLDCPRNSRQKTTLRFHQENLSDAQERERMKQRWKEALERLAGLHASS